VDQAGAPRRRAHMLALSPVLKYSLGQQGNVLDYRAIMDEGKSVIVNLALQNHTATRLLGCLLTVSAEQAALSRADVPSSRRGPAHHLCNLRSGTGSSAGLVSGGRPAPGRRAGAAARRGKVLAPPFGRRGGTRDQDASRYRRRSKANPARP